MPSVRMRSVDVSSAATLTPTESPMNENAPEPVTPRVTGMRSNPCDGKPSSLRSDRTLVVRGHPVRSLFQMPSKAGTGSGAVPMPPTFDVPHHDASQSASIRRVHRWSGLSGTSSYGSSTAGNEPPAVRGPLDAENSVETIAPAVVRRTTVAVSTIAWSVSECSRTTGVAFGDTRVAAPP